MEVVFAFFSLYLSLSCSDAEKNYLFQLDVVGDITAILDVFKFDPGVISEAFGVIACLSTLSVFVDTIGSVGVHRQVREFFLEYALYICKLILCVSLYVCKHLQCT